MPSEIGAVDSLTVEAFGVGVQITASPECLEAVRELLPPRSSPADQPPATGRFTLVPLGDTGLMAVEFDGAVFAGPVDLGVALGVLDVQIRTHIALNAPDHVFVHAGVVGVGERAIVLPGKSFAGKSTLVSALVQIGAEYWSDDFAVLDASGLVRPYANPLSIRNDTPHIKGFAGEGLGGDAADRPIPIGMVALARYRPGGSWTPRTLSRGEGALTLLEHTVCAKSRPEEAMEAVRRAVAEAVILDGERGEAAQTAKALITALAQPAT